MLDIFQRNHNYRFRSLVVTNHVVNMQALPFGHVVGTYKNEKRTFKEPFLSFQPKNVFVGNTRVCQKTVELGTLNSEDYDRNTLLLESSSAREGDFLDVTNSECNECCFGETIQTEFENNLTSCYGIVRFTTEKKIIVFISLMDNNVVATVKADGKNCTCFLSNHYKFIENGRIEEGFSLKSTAKSLDHFDYLVIKCDENAFKEPMY